MSVIWQYSNLHKTTCKVIDEQTLWGQTICRVWLPDSNAVVRVAASDLSPLSPQSASLSPDHITYLAAAAKVAELLESSAGDTEGQVLLAPMESNVIPLPHQIHALSRAISGTRVRYLLADEVGLGKTIEAGLIMRELKLRGRVRRTLVVSPKGIATQWVSEMQTHFNESFQLLSGDDLGLLQRMHVEQGSGYWAKNTDLREVAPARNPWTVFDQVVVSLDSVKPMERRQGWSAEKTAAYNRLRFEELITAGWDLIIIDESHRLGGSTEQVARYKLGRGLAEAAPYLLLLSATPHQGKSDAFHRLVSLLDRDYFPTAESVTREKIAPYVIRTEKRKAVDAEGKPLFKPRRTQLASVAWEARHASQERLYEAVTEYVREGYNRALREKKRHIGFLMILMQRLVVSSTRAIRTTLERRLAVLERNASQVELTQAEFFNDNLNLSMEEWEDLDGQEQLDLLQDLQVAHADEGAEVQALLKLARECEDCGPDAKAEALLEWVYAIQAEENDPDLKVLLFTEFVPTQAMLQEFLEARGISVVTLNGGMDMAERKKAQDAFCDRARVLLSTDAGGEGLNLQFAHVIINYDIPWNPMRLEQRIGRVDRIGQTKPVRAINFVFENSVEFRVREVLEQKLSVIFAEFGIDKTGDVLDSAEAGELFEGMFTTAVMEPDKIEDAVGETVTRLQSELSQVRESSAIYGISDEPDVQTAERLRTHPLPAWLERMTVGYVRAKGGQATQKKHGWHLQWPDGREQTQCVFNTRDAERLGDSDLLNLEDPQIRGLALNLPQITEGQPLSEVIIPGLQDGICGLWGLFEIRIEAGGGEKQSLLRVPHLRRGFLSVFLNKAGKQFQPTARHIWDHLQSADPEVLGVLDGEASAVAYADLHAAVQQTGLDIFETLRQSHLTAIDAEEKRGAEAYGLRRKAAEQVGLPEVRRYRLNRLAEELTQWREELEAARQVIPETRALLMLRIEEREGV